MKSEFQKYLESNQLCSNTDRILLGVSGGIDSVCMLHLFLELEIPIGIAHCNFQLRDEESDQDELFVSNLANKYDIPFFSTRFETQEIAKQEGISIQMAARDLRYDWFEEIRNKYDYNYIAIAHNRDDIIETFLINLTRGTGIKGLTGIKPKYGNIIRPLLFASRKNILSYLDSNQIEYREDSSNKTTKYSRNLIRHELIPLFELINPKFKETIIDTISKLQGTENIYFNNIEKTYKNIVREKGNKIYLSISKLKELHPLPNYLFEFLKPYGFSNSQINDIMDSLDGIPGKRFLSTTHRLIKDREELIIEELASSQKRDYYIDENSSFIENPIKLEISRFDNSPDFEMIKAKNIGYFDLDKLQFPLILRKWKKGDYFMPLGMKNLKKLSDFFIDYKLSISDKENTWILESNNKIIWIVGLRIDERFKISDSTQNIIGIKIVE